MAVLWVHPVFVPGVEIEDLPVASLWFKGCTDVDKRLPQAEGKADDQQDLRFF